MSGHDDDHRERWARFRYAVVGPLLASPPERGELGGALEELAGRTWKHPVDDSPVRFGLSTLERWYYQARAAQSDPVGALRRRERSDAGQQPSMSTALRETLGQLYREHPKWTVQLHADNLAALVDQDPALGPMASYSTVRRYMRRHGMDRKRGEDSSKSAAWRRAAQRREQLEVRSYEAAHVHALWHLDFHQCSRSVVTPDGRCVKPQLLGILDDHSRLCCHAQWYLEETAAALVHGLVQALEKRRVPGALMSDNGSAMRAGEFARGLEELGISHERTLEHSPYQNGKQEVFWGQIEGRLLAMLDSVRELTLDELNVATQAWVEMEYHRKPHDELEGATPLERYLQAANVGRPLPAGGSRELRERFRLRVRRRQRKSDGTITLHGRRFELPQAYRHLSDLTVRYARWDLSLVHLYDDRRRRTVCRIFPVDKQRNADGVRALRGPVATSGDGQTPVRSTDAADTEQTGRVAPLLARLIKEYRAHGLAPAYLPHRTASRQALGAAEGGKEGGARKRRGRNEDGDGGEHDDGEVRS